MENSEPGRQDTFLPVNFKPESEVVKFEEGY